MAPFLPGTPTDVLWLPTVDEATTGAPPSPYGRYVPRSPTGVAAAEEGVTALSQEEGVAALSQEDAHASAPEIVGSVYGYASMVPGYVRVPVELNEETR